MFRRIDHLLVERGLFESRSKAQAAIQAGGVTANGRTVQKASEKVETDAVIDAQPAFDFVSRAGLKLDHALTTFNNINISGKLCLDIGASTGGFTDVLLRAGAHHVWSVDVGRDQLHPSLLIDARVSNLSGLDARNLTREIIPDDIGIIVCDASFIALEKLMQTPLSLVSQSAVFIGLFKPQFQVGRTNVGRGGIVRDIDAIEAAWSDFLTWMDTVGWTVSQRIESPISGGDGNREFLFIANKA